MQTAREGEEEALIADEKHLVQINYREKFSESSNVKNYNIERPVNVYYIEESLINAQNTEVKEQTEMQPFCIYDEVCTDKKLCGNCAAYEYERIQYEEAWERRSMGKF